MHDLRKKALGESRKTVSRKARSKPQAPRSTATLSPDESPNNSQPGSRASSRPSSQISPQRRSQPSSQPSSRPGSRPSSRQRFRYSSRPVSRYATEDEAGSDSEDDMTMSEYSGSGDDVDDPASTWASHLLQRISELLDRKRNMQEREETLASYLHLVRHHFAENQIGRSSSDVIPALLRSAREGASEDERLLALKALMVTLLTCPSDKHFEYLFSGLKKLCQDAEEEDVKAAAIYALMIAARYGGGGDGDAEELLEFLVEIVETDGDCVNASDSVAVVTAALRAWGFVASFLDDMADRGEQAMDAFIEQLDSTEADVQSSAGTNIAFLFEAGREQEEETGDKPDFQHSMHKVMTRMGEIVRDSSKSVSKKTRKELRSDFNSIITSLERGVGPGYSTAGWNLDAGNATDRSHLQEGELLEFGYRETLRVGNQIRQIDTWVLHVRVAILRMVFGGGLATHSVENPAVRDMLKTARVRVVPTGVERKS
ncbi:interferon-related developmental regulator 1 [Echria macrotheca]|uniref:Interferon-related developmental regulator 1 n=1 Tax=Echria macrotheca TaxID=438768 RepID=A0AAJ0BPE2_9PEZI|nr:interferon-related developmental regulator 1 [Echria macrotheca]